MTAVCRAASRHRNPLYARNLVPSGRGPLARGGPRWRLATSPRRALLLIATLLIAACQPNTAAPSSSAPVAPGIGAQATFILANPGGLLALDNTARTLGRLVDLPPQSAPSAPSLHPSGKSIVFALTPQSDPKRGFGSDLYVVNLDGTGLRAVVQHESDNVFYASPRFDATGNVLYFHRRAAIIQSGSFTGNDDGIERLDLRTGERKRIVKDGADPTISPDGKTMIYVHLKDGQVDALWRADIDGANARPLLQTRDAFWYLQAPRFSPNDCTVVFSAAGHTVTRGGGVAGKLAHLSIPSDLFLVPCDGAGLKSIGQTGDDVVPAWSPDGTKIAYVGQGGFFVLDVKTGVARTVAQGQDFFFGDLLWLK
jgi:Tol biopolymer transport system component